MRTLENLESHHTDPAERYFSVMSSITITENAIEDSSFFEAWTRFRFSQFLRFRLIQGSLPPSLGDRHQAW